MGPGPGATPPSLQEGAAGRRRVRCSAPMATVDGFETVGIVSAGGALEAHFVPDANMLCHSLIHRGVELLHAGRGVQAYAERGKTMGIPLLHPWANRLSR